MLVIRFRGVRPITSQIAKVLKELKLKEILTAVFLRNDENTLEKLKLVEPYVIYGSPSEKLVEELILKRGHADISSERKLLDNNQLVEKHLGDVGVICLEDIVHELTHPSEAFSKVASFIWPFKLNFIEELKVKGKLPFAAGGQWGYRGSDISNLVYKMI